MKIISLIIDAVFLMFVFALLGAAQINDTVHKSQADTLAVKSETMHIVLVAENNKYNKLVGRTLKFENLIIQELDTIRAEAGITKN